MPPGPGIMNALAKARLKNEITKMSDEEQEVAKKVVDDIFRLRTNPIHFFVFLLVFSLVFAMQINIIHGCIGIGLSILIPILYKKLTKKVIMDKLDSKEQEILKRIFPKDFK